MLFISIFSGLAVGFPLTATIVYMIVDRIKGAPQPETLSPEMEAELAIRRLLRDVDDPQVRRDVAQRPGS